MRRVTLVCGPPCAGKSTFVGRGRVPGDTVADFDEIAQRLGSAGKWMHTPAIGDATEREMGRLIDSVASAHSVTAWIVRCAPDVLERAELAALLAADRVVVLLPRLGVLLERAKQRPDERQTRQAIMRWKDRYEPWVGDELVRS